MKIRNQWSREYPLSKEAVTGVSATVPDQTMPMRELVRRFAAGLPINGPKSLIYDEPDDPADPDLPDPRTLDLAELEELATANKQRIAEIQEELKTAEDKKKQERQRKAAEKQEKEIAERIKAELSANAK